MVDEQGHIVFGPPITGGEFTVGRPFPTTLYNWRLQIALTSAELLGQRVERQRTVEIGMVCFAAIVAIAGLLIVVVGSVRERHLALLKSDFVANVSHELKTPLALVRMFGEMLLSDRVPSDDKRRLYLSSSCRRASAFLRSSRTSRLRNGGARQGRVRVRPGDLGEVVARAVEVYRYRAEREGWRSRFTRLRRSRREIDGRAD